MATVRTIAITSGIPSSGTGEVSTIDNFATAVGSPSTTAATIQVSTTPNSSNNPIVVGLVSTSPGVVPFGQTTMANSLPVTLASNSTAFTVTPSSALSVTPSSAISVTLSSLVSITNTTVLHSTGGSNGYLTAPFTLFSTTELTSAIVSSGTALSSVGGSTGVFTQTNFGSAKQGYIWLTAGSSMVPIAGGNISGWWVQSPDGGTTFEKAPYTASPMPRAPDWIIPFSTAASLAAGDVVYAVGTVPLPWATTKVTIQNNSGVALSSAGCNIACGPVKDLG